MKTNRTLMLMVAGGLLATMLMTNFVRAQTINLDIIDPNRAYSDKTYSDWAAAWWKYYMSLPATNTPFNIYLNHAGSLSTGQSGPVWFIGGNYANGGTHSFTNSVPGGVALFLSLTDIEWDHAGCPTNNLSEAEMRGKAKSNQDQAYGMTCTIDGVAVTALTNALTTPYRVQSVAFSYTCPAVHNILHDLDGYSCYQNASGTSYFVDLAVEDGVFLMVAPLSAGQHVIHVTGAYTFGFTENWTQYITVEPVALTMDANTQSGSSILSWPQTPDNYTLQASSSLGLPNWQPAGFSVVLSNGVYQTTIPVGTSNQFFRLKLN